MTGSNLEFDGIWTENGWLEPGFVTLDENQIVTKIHKNRPEKTIKFDGWLLPSIVNSHSHSFQFAMAGTSEHRHPSGIPDDFWSWRNNMYKLANSLSPDQAYDIARLLYRLMVAQGCMEYRCSIKY